MKLHGAVSIIIITLIYSACEQPTTFERINNNDPGSDQFIPNSVENFQLSIEDSHVRLNWESGSNFVDGFLIEKLDSEGKFSKVSAVDDDVMNYRDETESIFNGTYRLSYLIGDEIFVQEKADYDINPSEFSIEEISPYGLRLQWIDNSYFNTEFRIERQGKDGNFETIGTTKDFLNYFINDNFNQNTIGQVRYRIRSESEIDYSDYLEANLRLPFWSAKAKLPLSSISINSILYQDYIYSISNDGRFNKETSFKISLRDFSTFTVPSPDIEWYNLITSINVVGDKFLVLDNTGHHHFYNTISGKWTKFKNDILGIRLGQSVTKLKNGRLLIAGGLSESNIHTVLKSAILFDPASDSWIELPDMNYPRVYHNTTLLDNGDIFVVGGQKREEENVDPLKAEIYDISNNEWKIVGSSPVYPRSVTKLNNGTILVASENGSVIYDPLMNSWSNQSNYENEHIIHRSLSKPSIITLSNGNVLIIGLRQKIVETAIEDNKAQLYLSKLNKWVAIGDLVHPRYDALLFEDIDKNVFIVGGQENYFTLWKTISFFPYSKFND